MMGNVYLLSQSDRLRLTSDAYVSADASESISYSTMPARWDSSGRNLAVVREERVRDSSGKIIWHTSFEVFDARSGRRKTLFSAPRILAYDWVPKEETVVLSAIGLYDNGCSQTYNPSLRKVNVNGGEVTNFLQVSHTLGGGQVVVGLNFSPDGKFLAYNIRESCQSEGTGYLCLKNLATGSSFCLIDDQRNETSWSPDGGILAYDWATYALPERNSPVVAMSPQTRQEAFISPADGAVYTSAKFSPDGNHLAYIRYNAWSRNIPFARVSSPELWIENYDGTGVEFVAEGVEAFDWGSDSRTLVFDRGSGQGKAIVVADVADSHHQQTVADGRSPQVQPAGSPADIPIILVHGCGTTVLDSWVKDDWIDNPSKIVDITSDGVQEVLFKGNSPVFGRVIYALEYGKASGKTVEQIASGLPAAIDRVKQETGASQVLLITHSMGAIVSRIYLEDLSDQKFSDREDVAGLYMLAPPNKGSFWVQSFLGSLFGGFVCPQALELAPFSPLIKKLNDRPLPERLEYSLLIGDKVNLKGVASDGIIATEAGFFFGTASAHIKLSGGVIPVVHSSDVVQDRFGTAILAYSPAKRFMAEQYQEDFIDR